MKHENRYQVICEMLQAYDMATGNQGADHVIKNPHSWLDNPYQPFYANAARLLIEAAESMDTKTGGGKTIVAALKRVVKNSPEHIRGMFETIDAAGSTKYTLIDGHRILRLDSDYSSIEHAEKAPFPSETVNKMIEQDDRINRSGEALNLPTIAELKAFIAEQKAKHGNKNNIPICLDGVVYVNPQYLLDFMQALPGCKAYKPESWKSPIYFIADNGDGILLPVNPSAYQATKAA